MKTLTLLRHAKSAPESSDGDFKRSLNERGRSDCHRMAKEMRDFGLCYDLVLASPARRVVETVAGVGVLSPTFDRRIYDATASELLEIVVETHDSIDRLLLVGHNPGLEQLAARLTGNAVDDMPTGALAEIELPAEQWRDAAKGGGQLIRLLKPKDLA